MTTKFDATIRRDTSGNPVKRNRSDYLNNDQPRYIIIDVAAPTGGIAAGEYVAIAKLPAPLFALAGGQANVAGKVFAAGFISNDTASRKARAEDATSTDGVYTGTDANGYLNAGKELATFSANSYTAVFPGLNNANAVGSDEQTVTLCYAPTAAIAAGARLQVRVDLLHRL